MNKQESMVILLPTDKPSRLSILNSGKLNFGAEIINSSNSKPQHIYITNDEKIKEGDWYIDNHVIIKAAKFGLGNEYKPRTKKIILTTDQDLINDGVQSIDDELLEWFVKNPSCERVEVQNKKLFDGFLDPEYGSSKWRFEYKIIIPIEEPKQETLEEAAERIAMTKDWDFKSSEGNGYYDYVEGFIEGAKWNQERMYSREEMKKGMLKMFDECNSHRISDINYERIISTFIENLK